MRSTVTVRLLFVLLAATPLAAGNAAADEPAMKLLTVDVIQGYAAISSFPEGNSDSARVRGAVNGAFAGQEIHYFVPPNAPAFNCERMLSAIQRAHVLYLNVHGSVFDVPVNGAPTKMHGMQVAPSPSAWTSPKGNSILTAAAVASALQNGKGPRLVILNGCNFANPGDGAMGANRMSIALGVPDNATGRALLGWPYAAEGSARDLQFAEFLSNWTKKKPDGQYPTLHEAWEATGWEIPSMESAANFLEGNPPVKDPTIIGDPNLRYKMAYVLRPADGQLSDATRLPMEWQEDGKDAATVQLFFPEKEIQALQAMGVTFERAPTFLAKRESDELVARDPRLNSALETFAKTLGKLVAEEVEVKVDDFSLHFRPGPEKLPVTIKAHATAVLKSAGKPPKTQVTEGSYSWVAEPGSGQ